MHNTYAILILLVGLWGGLLLGSALPLHAQNESAVPDSSADKVSVDEYSDEEIIDRLVSRPELTTYYADMAEQAVEGVRQSPLTLPESGRALLIEQARQAYDSTYLAQDVRSYIRAQYDDALARVAAEGLAQPVVEQVDAQAAYDANFEAIQAHGQTLSSEDISEERIQAVRTLIQSGDGIAAFTNTVVRLQHALFQAAQHIDPDAAEAIDRSVLEERVRNMATNIVPLTMFYTYRAVPTDTLSTYADFYTSEAGQWYHQVSVAAQAHAEQQAAERLVKGIQDAVDARD